VTAHAGQDPAEAVAPAPPNPPRDTELEAEAVLMPPDDLDPQPPEPEPPLPEHAIGCPVTGSLHWPVRTTEVAMTPPPSRTRVIAVVDLMA
jgi:hypothetical protein